MKKFLLALLFVIALTGVSVTASYAGADCEPGCDCKKDANGAYAPDSVFGAQEQMSEAEQVKEKAYAQEIIKQPDNAPGMTCLDRAMGLTASLGNIFSDKFPAKIPAASTSVFGKVTYPDAGTGASDPTHVGEGPGKGGPYGVMLKNVVSENLKKYAGNFDDFNNTESSLSAALGATSLTGLDDLASKLTGPLGLASGTINGIFNSINDIIGTVGNVLGTINDAWDSYGGYFNSAMSYLGLGEIATMVGSVFNVLDSIQGYVDTVGTYFDDMQTAINGFMNSYLNIDHMTQGATADCDRISKLWGSGSFDKALTGTGNDRGAPYFSLKQMLSSTNMPTIGKNLTRALGNDNSVLQTAFDTLETGVLSGPGGPVSSSGWQWRGAPIIPDNASIDDIIGVMN